MNNIVNFETKSPYKKYISALKDNELIKEVKFFTSLIGHSTSEKSALLSLRSLSIELKERSKGGRSLIVGELNSAIEKINQLLSH